MADPASYTQRQAMLAGQHGGWSAARPPLPAHPSPAREHTTPPAGLTSNPLYQQHLQQQGHLQHHASPKWSQPSSGATARSSMTDSEASGPSTSEPSRLQLHHSTASGPRAFALSQFHPTNSMSPQQHHSPVPSRPPGAAANGHHQQHHASATSSATSSAGAGA